MARKPRLHLPGGIYHVMLRGNAGHEIFFSDADRSQFYLLIQQGIECYGHRIHAFCLMPNHLHLVIQVAEESLAKIMQNLSFRYTRWINRQQHRSGHLFQGRYQAVLVDADNYLLELVRYIHLSPVRAGLIPNIDQDTWSSHRAYLGEATIPWLHCEWILSRFATRLSTSRKRYLGFIHAGKGEGDRVEFHGGGSDSRILGDETYVRKVTGRMEVDTHVPELETIISYLCTEYGVTEAELLGRGNNRRYAEVRGIIGWLAVKTKSAHITEMAARLGRDATTLSRRISGIATQIRQSKKFARTMMRYKQAIMQV